MLNSTRQILRRVRLPKQPYGCAWLQTQLPEPCLTESVKIQIISDASINSTYPNVGRPFFELQRNIRQPSQ